MRAIVPALLLISCGRHEPPAPAPSPAPIAPMAMPSPSASAPVAPPDDFSKVLGWWESNYSALDNRAKNIDRARSALDGVRVAPGAEFSFNASVGPRTLDRGYFFAPVINGGEMETGIGGGVCQVSSTVFAAVLMAGLDVTARIPHSRPSTYMPIGLDATVSFPPECGGDAFSKGCYAPDLRFRNGDTTPVMFRTTVAPHAKWKGYSVLRVEILGAVDPGPRPTYTWGVKTTDPFEQKLRRVSGKPAGFKKRKQKGLDGAIVTGSITSILPDGTKSTHVIRSVYPATDEIWEVGDDWPEGTNPWDVPASVDAGVPDAG